MKKNLLIYSLILIMISVLLPTAVFAESAKLTVKAPEAVPAVGEEFTVTVELSNNPGVCAVQFTLAYDKSKLECTAASTGLLLNGMLAVANPDADTGAIVAAATTDPIEDDGIIGAFKFVLKDAVETLDFAIADVTLKNQNSEDIPYEVIGADFVEKAEPPKEEKPEPTEKPAEVITPEPEENVQGGESYVEEPTQPEVQTPNPTEPPKDQEAAKPDAAKLFGDVAGHWGAEFINKAAEKGLFNGDEKGNFNPDANVTRAQYVTVLWRLAGKPEAADTTPFEDIDSQIPEFKSAIAWGYSNGYINGTDEKTFMPEGTLTREAAMKILYYYSGGKSGDEKLLTAIYDGFFEDSSSISKWAKDPMYWAVYNELISGTSETTLSPQNTATRAQLAKILVNYVDTYK